MTKPTPADQQRRPPSELSLDNRLTAIEARLTAIEATLLPMRPIGPMPTVTASTPNLTPRRMEAIRLHLESSNRAVNGETAAETDKEGRKAVSAPETAVEGQGEGESDAD